MSTENVNIRAGSPPVIELHGAIDNGIRSTLTTALQELADQGADSMLIDCSDAGPIDDDGVAVLAGLHALSTISGVHVRFLDAPPQIAKVLYDANVEQWFEISPRLTPETQHSVCRAEYWRSSRFIFPATVENATHIRHKVMAFAEAMPFSRRQLEDICLAVGEAASNAVRHGSPSGESCRVCVECVRLDDRLEVKITDQGLGFDPEAKICKDPCLPVEGGRGLYFMRMLMDDVRFAFHHGTTVCMVKRVDQTDG